MPHLNLRSDAAQIPRLSCSRHAADVQSEIASGKNRNSSEQASDSPGAVSSLASRAFIAIQLIFLSLSLVGCAHLSHVPVTDFDKPCGIPYYQGSWYLLVYSDGHGNLKSELLYLLDKSKKMEAQPTQVLSFLDVTLKFTGGVLNKSQVTADTSEIPKAIIAAAEKFLSTAVMNAVQQAPNTVPAPSIYKIRMDSPTKATFIGEDSAETVQVRVP